MCMLHRPRWPGAGGVQRPQGWRIWPFTPAAAAWSRSLNEPRLEALALDIPARIGYRGIANMNSKARPPHRRVPAAGVNRVSQWGILTTRCGVNPPWLAWRDTQGLPAPITPPVRRRWVCQRAEGSAGGAPVRAEGLTRWSDYLVLAAAGRWSARR